MKKLILILLLFHPSISIGQYQYYFLKESFFGRQPSARAEAMGRSYASVDGDMTTVYFNPAGTATIEGFEINGSLSSPYYLAKKANYNYISAGYKIKNYLIFGLSSNNFNFGENVYISDLNDNIIGGPYIPRNSIISLTVSSQPIKNLFLGINANYFIWQPIDEKATSVYFDFGAIKKFQFLQNETSGHSINVGASIANFNYAKITLDFRGKSMKNDLPVITRFAANYQFNINKHLIIDTLNTIRFLLQCEYQKVLNSSYESAIRSGVEIMFLEILSIRAGCYKEKEYDFGVPSANNSEISAFTYGLGLQIPIYKLIKTPLNINFDYTSLPQPSYSKTNTNWDNFTTYNLRLNWVFKGKK